MIKLFFKIFALLIWVGSFATAQVASSVRSSHPAFDKTKDLLLAQFDNKPDADDIHSQAALGCMQQHPDLQGVTTYAVQGAYGKQGGKYIDSTDLFNLIYGVQGDHTWTDAHINRANSVTRIVNKVRPILLAGGRVWVQEAGQSDITALWIKALIDGGIPTATTQSNIFVVQHSTWNENQASTGVLDYVKANSTYIKIADGNSGNNGTPDYNLADTVFMNEVHNGLANPKAEAMWLLAAEIIEDSGFSASYSVIHLGGVDFSDCVENWWILNIGTNADTVRKFWDRYVVGAVDHNIFQFNDKTNVAVNTPTESSRFVLAGLSASSPISIVGGEYAISTNGGTSYGAWTSSSGTVANGNIVKARVTSSASYSTTQTTTLTVAGLEKPFSVTTQQAPPNFTLNVTASNGTVTLSPPGGVYAPGTVVTLSPNPSVGYQLQSWSGALSGNSNPATITMDADKNVTANFWQPTGVTIDTTGRTIVMNYDNSQNTYIGNGTLQISKTGGGTINLATGGSSGNTVFAMTGGIIAIDSGVRLVNGGWQKGIWTNNRANVELNGTLDLWDGNPAYVNALSGSGTIAFGSPSGSGFRELYVGMNGGSGTFSGAIADPQYAGQNLRIVKNGAGTQVFNNLANQKPKEIVINGGAVDLNTSANATMVADVSGAGNLIKSGAGTLTLSGVLSCTGSITVGQGTLLLPVAPSVQSNFVVAAGSSLNLSFSSTVSVSSLQLGSSGNLPPGIYGKDHPVYGSFFTGGSGMFRIAGSNYQVWTGTNAVGNEGDDFDADGVPNLMEYVLGADPRVASDNIVPVATERGAFLEMTFKRTDASEQDTVIVGEWSLNLVDWFSFDVTIETTNENGSDSDDMLVKIPLSKMQNGKLFARITADSN